MRKINNVGFMKSRNASETILGYFYQFDKTIIEVFKQINDDNVVTIEGIEDIDIDKTNEVETIQCKYHEALEYNHSQIKKAIIFLLKDFVKMLEQSINILCMHILSQEMKN